MLAYTSVTKNYIPKARVLARSVKHFHPDWNFQLVLSDNIPPDFDLSNEPFDGVVTIDQLGISNWKSWAFGHTVVELCTAVKGRAGMLFASRPGVNKIMYIDPDIKVFNSLASLDDLLDEHEVLLTPHLLVAEKETQAIMDNEIAALKHGVFNLGFFAARTSGQGLEFIKWWEKRLMLFCIDDIPGGLFTDQRWCDLAPCFFDRLHVVRDKGCNVATWNVAHRLITKNADGSYQAGGVPLRFYHFTGYDSGDGLGMLMRYAANQRVAHELWDGYAADLNQADNDNANYQNWLYGKFGNGTPIPLEARRLYRLRGDVRAVFPDPYTVVEPSFLSWWLAEASQGNLTMPTHSVAIKHRTVIERVMQGVCSPSIGINIAKSAMGVLKREGISGLIQRIRKHS
jgi:hypothetical protein